MRSIGEQLTNYEIKCMASKTIMKCIWRILNNTTTHIEDPILYLMEAKVSFY